MSFTLSTDPSLTSAADDAAAQLDSIASRSSSSSPPAAEAQLVLSPTAQSHRSHATYVAATAAALTTAFTNGGSVQQLADLANKSIQGLQAVSSALGHVGTLAATTLAMASSTMTTAMELKSMAQKSIDHVLAGYHTTIKRHDGQTPLFSVVAHVLDQLVADMDTSRAGSLSHVCAAQLMAVRPLIVAHVCQGAQDLEVQVNQLDTANYNALSLLLAVQSSGLTHLVQRYRKHHQLSQDTSGDLDVLHARYACLSVCLAIAKALDHLISDWSRSDVDSLPLVDACIMQGFAYTLPREKIAACYRLLMLYTLQTMRKRFLADLVTPVIASALRNVNRHVEKLLVQQKAARSRSPSPTNDSARPSTPSASSLGKPETLLTASRSHLAAIDLLSKQHSNQEQIELNESWGSEEINALADKHWLIDMNNWLNRAMDCVQAAMIVGEVQDGQ